MWLRCGLGKVLGLKFFASKRKLNQAQKRKMRVKIDWFDFVMYLGSYYLVTIYMWGWFSYFGAI